MSERAGSRREKKKRNVFFIIACSIYLLISVAFLGYVISINMLPTSYIVAIIIADIIVTGLISLGILKRNKGYALNIVFTVLAVVIIGVYAFAYNYINATMNFIGTMAEEVEETEEYYVITLNNGKFSKIEEADGKNMHIFSADEDYSDIKADIATKAKVTYKNDESLVKLAEDILSGKSYFALVSASQYSMIKDDNKDFESKTKIIYTINHKISKKEEKVIDENSDKTTTNGVFNVYISGIDTSGNIGNVSRSDSNTLVTVNTNTHEVLLTSIPRDYYVTLHSKGAKDKLTHSGIYGISETVSTIEDLLDTEINYYVRVNFTTVIKLVDTLGGIDVESDYTFTSSDGPSFVKGMNHMNGKQALAFSRERHSFVTGDNQRIKNQQKVIEAIINKVLNSTTLMTKYTSILSSLSGSFQTNISQDDISVLVKKQLQDMPSWKISMNSLSGSGASMATYSAGSQLLYVMVPNQASVTEAKDKINKVLGEN